MTNQSMMLGVPAGAEPVSDRSIATPPAAEPKPKRKREIRGVVKTSIDGEDYKVEMRETGITVRRCNKHHVDVKPLREIVDFVIGQERLPFAEVDRLVRDAATDDLLESCIEFIALQIAESNNPGKHQGRYQLAASALREQVEILAPWMIEKVRSEL